MFLCFCAFHKCCPCYHSVDRCKIVLGPPLGLWELDLFISNVHADTYGVSFFRSLKSRLWHFLLYVLWLRITPSLPSQVLSQHLLTMPCNPDDQTLEMKAYYLSTFFAFRFYPIVSFLYILQLDVHSTWRLATNPKNGHHKDQGACWIIKQHSRHDHYIIKINNLHLTTQTVATLT